MKNRLNSFLLLLLLSLLLTTSVWAKDFGPAADISQIRKTVLAKYPQVANISASHDWALCLSNFEENDISVVLHRVQGKWKIVKSDGGAFTSSDLEKLGVPKVDQAALQRSYQP